MTFEPTRKHTATTVKPVASVGLCLGSCNVFVNIMMSDLLLIHVFASEMERIDPEKSSDSPPSFNSYALRMTGIFYICIGENRSEITVWFHWLNN